MKLKKVTAILLSLLMAVGFTACSSNNNKEKTDADTKAEKPTKIVVASGSSSVPNSYVESGIHKGQEADIWKEISNKTGLEVEFITGEFNSLFGYLDSGKADTVGNTITINEDRLEKYDFSEAYAYIPEKLIVHADKTNIKKLKDIDGLVCGFTSGSNGKNLFKQVAKDQGINIDVVAYDSAELLDEAFKQKKVDVMLLAAGETAYKIKEGILDARMVEEDVTVGAKAYPFKKGDKKSEELRKTVTKAIQDMKDDGTLAKIYDKWYGMDFSNAPEGVEILQ